MVRCARLSVVQGVAGGHTRGLCRSGLRTDVFVLAILVLCGTAMGAPRTHYDIMGVNWHASALDIKVAFYECADKVHPDKPGSTAAEFRTLYVSYEVLLDPQARTQYDERMGFANRPRPSATARASPAPDFKSSDSNRLKVGDWVVLRAGHEHEGFPLLRAGQVALLVEDDESLIPFKVSEGGQTQWMTAASLTRQGADDAAQPDTDPAPSASGKTTFTSERLREGDRVVVKKGMEHKAFPMMPGEVGVVMEDDGSAIPFRVRVGEKDTWMHEQVLTREGATDAATPAPRPSTPPSTSPLTTRRSPSPIPSSDRSRVRGGEHVVLQRGANDECLEALRPEQVAQVVATSTASQRVHVSVGGGHVLMSERCLTLEGAADAFVSLDELEALVSVLQRGSVGAQENVARVFVDLVANSDAIRNRIVDTAGALDALVGLLRGGSAGVQEQAAGALMNLAEDAENRRAIAAACAVVPLVPLLSSSSAGVQDRAAGALRNLAEDAENKRAIAAAGAVVQIGRAHV